MRRNGVVKAGLLGGASLFGCLWLSIFGVFAVSILLAVLSIPIKMCGGLNIEYSNGSRSGVVQKFSKKGLYWQTHEGELNLGYTESDSEGRLVPAIFPFSCSSDEVAKEIEKAQRGGNRVTLQYKQYLFRGWKYGGTGYDIVGVEQ